MFLCGCKENHSHRGAIIPLGGTRYVETSADGRQVTIGGMDTISVRYKTHGDEIDTIVYHLHVSNGWVRGADTNADGVMDVRVVREIGNEGFETQHPPAN